MPIEPRDFLDQSRRLINGNAEVDHRSAVSRAYYCALHSCIQICQLMPGGFEDNYASSHESVIKQLVNSPSEKPFSAVRRQCIALGVDLRKGKVLRRRADYLLTVSFDLSTAKQHISKMGLIKVQADHVMKNIIGATTSKTA